MKMFEIIGKSWRHKPVRMHVLAETHREAVQKAARRHVKPVTVRLFETEAEQAAAKEKAIEWWKGT